MVEQEIKVIFNKRITADTFLMGFSSSEIATESKPGQFVMIRVKTGIDPFLRRPFSICGIGEDDLVYVLYRVIGRGTAIMAETGEGERLSIIGPLGKGFKIPESDNKVLLVSGGIGVAPLFFLAQVMKARDIEFLMGFGSSEEIIDIDRIYDLSIGTSIATDDGTKGYSGMVTDLLDEYLNHHQVRMDSFSLIACGPLAMLKRVASMALYRKIPCQVSLEAVMACGLGACQGCAVRGSARERQISYYHVCKDGPVFPAHTINWNCL
ncbi:dihydroorotate dehydrogenase electron transfer subunit [Thermodesulfobacteriota bacterium]